MYQSTDPDIEVSYRQRQIQAGFVQAQRQVSVDGLRQILGNTVIELGGRIHGVTKAPCVEAAEARGRVRSVFRTDDTSTQPRIIH